MTEEKYLDEVNEKFLEESVEKCDLTGTGYCYKRGLNCNECVCWRYRALLFTGGGRNNE